MPFQKALAQSETLTASSWIWTRFVVVISQDVNHYTMPFRLWHILEFFTSASADGFSLESGWQQVSSSLQDSSQYTGRLVVWMVSTRPPTSSLPAPLVIL